MGELRAVAGGLILTQTIYVDTDNTSVNKSSCGAPEGGTADRSPKH